MRAMEVGESTRMQGQSREIKANGARIRAELTGATFVPSFVYSTQPLPRTTSRLYVFADTRPVNTDRYRSIPTAIIQFVPFPLIIILTLNLRGAGSSLHVGTRTARTTDSAWYDTECKLLFSHRSGAASKRAGPMVSRRF